MEVLTNVGTCGLFAFFGVLFLLSAFKIFDIFTPGDLAQEIKSGNVAYAVVAGCFLVAVGMIIAAAIA